MSKYRKFLANEVFPYLQAKNKKPISQQLSELYKLWRVYDCLPYQYFKHRLYNNGHVGKYIDYIPPIIIKGFQIHCNPADRISMISNKFETNQILRRAGLNCVGALLMADKDGTIRDGTSGAAISVKHALAIIADGPADLFVKPIDGGVGDGALCINKSDVDDDFLRHRPNTLIQPRIKNHPLLAAIFDKSLNTIRVDTLIDGDDVILTAACLKVGTGEAQVDNWAKGAIAVGVNVDDGALAAVGVTKAAFGRRQFESHPDTGFRFEGKHVPYWSEVLDLARAAAKAMRPHVTLGWDIAVTQSGPTILEANETGDFFLLQEAVGPLAGSRLAKLACALWTQQRELRTERTV
jgi:putative polysaccharide biosynthesis protein